MELHGKESYEGVYRRIGGLENSRQRQQVP